MKKHLKNDEGSFTFEASLVFPVILFTLCLLMFFCVLLFQKSMLSQYASASAERSSYSWENSHKEPKTGAFPESEYDRLYWRLADDHMLGSLFGTFGAESTSSIPVPSEVAEGNLTAQKMSQTTTSLPPAYSGTMEYENKLMNRQITTKIDQFVSLPMIGFLLSPDRKIYFSGRAAVVEPDEFIRNIELLRYYGARFSGMGTPGNPSEIAQILEKLMGK
ncbi:TadE family protein [Paenibacillus sp. Marseille-Q4541]|uniref:TadE family protein n=1 Tax=Paenibacillus sp. Marseille-Q4541 TaxID=2831522 RepID=UPI001BACE438|nr:TadE family protein [Paenibacillus sp. Marseille-Q4541]